MNKRQSEERFRYVLMIASVGDDFDPKTTADMPVEVDGAVAVERFATPAKVFAAVQAYNRAYLEASVMNTSSVSAWAFAVVLPLQSKAKRETHQKRTGSV